jgi:glucosyl-3-phosphoglycerate synthase
MADFYQHAALATLHHLAVPEQEKRNEELKQWVKKRPVALLLPALFAEMERPALPSILEEVSGIDYIEDVVMSMNRMSASQQKVVEQIARRQLKGKRLHLINNDSAEWQTIFKKINDENLGVFRQGKGTNIWSGLLYLTALKQHYGVVSHDTDIMNYTSSLLAKLTFPLVHPEMGYNFCKGYYSRVTDRLHGRLTRLFIFPLLAVLEELSPDSVYLKQIRAYRYPLSGEFSGNLEIMSELDLPSGWGLEVATLASISKGGIEACQIDLGFHFEHRHRPLENKLEDQTGLIQAAREVVQALLYEYEKAEGCNIKKSVEELQKRYQHKAEQWLVRYRHTALINGIHFDEFSENEAIQLFTNCLGKLEYNLKEKLIKPNGYKAPAQVFKSLPNLKAEVVDAVKVL